MRVLMAGPSIRTTLFVFLLLAPQTRGLAQESAPVLPPVDPNATVAEAQKTVDEAIAKRVTEMDAKIAELEAELDATTSTAERIDYLEQRLQLAESRGKLERARAVGRARPKYTAGFKLLNDMETKSSGLVAAGYSVAALNAVSDLTDLRRYDGFQRSFGKLLSEVGNDDEKSWLRSLVEAAIPKVAPAMTSLSAFTPLIGPAAFALSQLKNILPAFAKDKLDGNELKDTYTQLMCGLDVVSQLHDDLSDLAIQNAQWTRDIEALRGRLPTEMTHYRSLVELPLESSEAEFYLAVDKHFTDQMSTAPDVFLPFMDNVEKHTGEFEVIARAYHTFASQHLAYWSGLREAVLASRNMVCMQNDTDMKQRFDKAIAQIETASTRLKDAYMFIDQTKPEYEYYRVVTATMNADN